MTSPEYQAPTWVNEDDPDFIEGVSPDLGAGYLNQLSGAVAGHGQRLGAITPVVTTLQATALDQAAGDNRYILQSNANGFAPAEATATALAGKVAKSANLSDLASAAAARTNLGLAALAASGKLADATDLTTTGTAVDGVLAVATVSGGAVTGWKMGAPTARRRMYDVRDYLGSDDIGAAVIRAIRAAKADTYGDGRPGQVVLPSGNWALTTSINWFMADGSTAHGVDVIGSGWGKTILRPQGKSAAFQHFSTSGSEALRDVMLANLEIDGSEQTLEGGSYETRIKGTYMTRLRRVVLDHLYVHDTGATGIGNDFHDACTIRDVVADGCGRLNPGTAGGGAGIGIGTGVWAIEALVIDGCVTRHNGRAGVFFETQSGGYPMGARLLGHVSEYNGTHGIEDAGCRGLSVAGGTSRKNGVSGFAAAAGTIPPAGPGIEGLVAGLTLAENTLDGILVDYSVRYAGDGTGTDAVAGGFQAYEQDGSRPTFPVEHLGYRFSDTTTRNNGRDGVHIVIGGNNPRGLTLSGVMAYANDEAGINLAPATGGQMIDLTIDGCIAKGNGRDAAASVRTGIRLGARTAGLRITNTRTKDDAAAPTQIYGLTSRDGTLHRNALLNGNDFRDNLTASTNLAGAFTGTPSYGLNPGLPASPGAAAPTYADSFNRADAATLGSTDDGAQAATAWTIADAGTGGGFVILNKSARVKTGGTGNVAATIDVGVVAGTHRVAAKAVAVAPSGGLALRVQDASNLLFIPFRKTGSGTNEYAIEKRVAGTRSVLVGSGVVPADGDRIRVVDTGTVITLYVNDVQIATVTDSTLNTQTKAGLHGNAIDTNTFYTDWSFTPA